MWDSFWLMFFVLFVCGGAMLMAGDNTWWMPSQRHPRRRLCTFRMIFHHIEQRSLTSLYICVCGVDFLRISRAKQVRCQRHFQGAHTPFASDVSCKKKESCHCAHLNRKGKRLCTSRCSRKIWYDRIFQGLVLEQYHKHHSFHHIRGSLRYCWMPVRTRRSQTRYRACYHVFIVCVRRS